MHTGYCWGKPEENMPLLRPRRRCMDNIKMNLSEIEWGGTDQIDLAEDRSRWRVPVNRIVKFQVP
jgi:hypothetical protein